MKCEVRTRSERETHEIAARLGARLRRGDVVALDGALGAGKTRFVRGLAEGLGVSPADVSSPTFVLCHEHAARPPHRPGLVHVDAYRLGDADELDTFGWDEIIEAEDRVVAVEWAARIASRLPAMHIRVTLAHAPAEEDGEEAPTVRRLVLEVPDALEDRLDGVIVAPKRGTCPKCGRRAVVDAPHAPFCSSRCRYADLGDWFDERHRIAGRDPGMP